MIKRELNFNVPSYSPEESHYGEYLLFLQGYNGDSYVKNYEWTTVGSMEKIIDLAVKASGLKGLRKIYFSTAKANLYHYAEDGTTTNMILNIEDSYAASQDGVQNPEDVIKRDMCVSISGEKTIVDILYKAFVDTAIIHKSPKVTWKYRTDSGVKSKPVYLGEPKPVYDEFYPWLDVPLKDFYRSYLESDSNILLLLGPPGTAKTTMLRDLIFQSNLNTLLTYDEGLLGSDSFFISYLTNKEHDMLVVEDADVMLYDRETDANKVMSKLLNVSDGLIKVMDKKMVFTANITDIKKVDQALIRPGRCFGVMEFRALTYDEAVKAAEAAGLPAPKGKKRSYTAAEIYKSTELAVHNEKKNNRVGFI